MIISVWGNSGSGTSTVAIKLALCLSKKSKNVLLIDSNFIAPQAKIWFPKSEIKPEQSLAVILANNVELDNVANKITMVNDYLGYLGYGKDLAINTIPNRDDTPSALLNVANNISDYVVVDCQSNITQDVMSFMALDLADTKIINMTPDLRGLSWYNSNVMMLKEKWQAQGSHVLKAFNKVKIISPADAMERVLGNIDFYLPYYEEMEEELYNGTIGEDKYKGRSKKYGQVINTIVNEIIEFNTPKMSEEPQNENTDNFIQTSSEVQCDENTAENFVYDENGVSIIADNIMFADDVETTEMPNIEKNSDNDEEA
jgi:MinD-like ATPase involved in chromosome partitioning or flagellar assembly